MFLKKEMLKSVLQRKQKWKQKGLKKKKNTWLYKSCLIWQWFSGYRCESDMPIYQWMVTWNYAYGSFQQSYLYFMLFKQIAYHWEVILFLKWLCVHCTIAMFHVQWTTYNYNLCITVVFIYHGCMECWLKWTLKEKLKGV